MGNPLQQRRTPQELAANSQVIEIAGKIGDFERLTEIAATDLAALDEDKIATNWREREIAGELRFEFIDAQGKIPALQGQLTATIDAVCQRCLEACLVPLQTDLRLLFAGEDAIEKDGEKYEVWELDGEDFLLAELVEEALIMALPYVAMHEGDANCAAKSAPGETAEKMTLPFANLKAQMQQEN